jgi:hypothetical protein
LVRWLVLIAFGGFGTLLLSLGWLMYWEKRKELDRFAAVEGVVIAVDKTERKATIRYPGAEAEITLETVIPSEETKVGDRTTVRFDPKDPTQARVSHWTDEYTETLVLGGFGLVGIGLGLGGFFTVTPFPARRI